MFYLFGFAQIICLWGLGVLYGFPPVGACLDSRVADPRELGRGVAGGCVA